MSTQWEIDSRDHTFMTSMKNVQVLPPLPPPPPFFLSEWVRIGQDSPAPGRRSLGYQLPFPNPISSGILAAY